MTGTKKYESLYETVEASCSVLSVEHALFKVGFTRPTLYYGPALDLCAKQIGHENRINVAIDEDLGPEEWYVSYQKRSFGSLGR